MHKGIPDNIFVAEKKVSSLNWNKVPLGPGVTGWVNIEVSIKIEIIEMNFKIESFQIPLSHPPIFYHPFIHPSIHPFLMFP